MAKKKIPTAEDNFKAGLIDLTKTGPLTYRELQSLNNGLPAESETNQLLNDRPGSAFFKPEVASQINYTNNPNEDFGESGYDEPLANQYQYEDYQDLRGERQPWYAQLGAGLAKGAILAGTTFLDGTLGLVVGAGTAINEGRWSGLWDNDFSRAMKAVNEVSEELMPNYYTDEERNEPWYSNIFTSNFIGDKFLKNLGFSVGALYSGGIYSKGISGLSKLIGTVAKSTKAPAMINTAVGATMSAVNEGRIEALNNSTDWYNTQKAMLDSSLNEELGAFDISKDDLENQIRLNQQLEAADEWYRQNGGKSLVRMSDGSAVDPAYVQYQKMVGTIKGQYQKLQDTKENYEQILAKMNEDKAKMGNADLLMNLPILMASNIAQFTKFYSNGFKTARKSNKIIGRAGEYAPEKTAWGGRWAVTKGALSEGTEEISQGAASRIAGNYYQDDVQNFYKSRFDPEAEQETLSWMKSFAQGINETVNDGSAWEEFFIGTLTGALGIPTFKKRANGKYGIGIEGGAYNEYQEYKEQMAREQEIADRMNERVQSPEFLNYYQGLIRHNKYQGMMNDAADRGDEFEYKNAEHAQFVSDISMFDNAGRLGDLKTLINEAFDTSDENLDSIIRNTTAKTEDGELVGPYAQYAQIDQETGEIVSNFGDEQSKQDMIDKLTASRDEMLKSVDDYIKIKDNLDINTKGVLTDEQLEELTWMKSQLGNWAERATAVSGEIKSAIGNVIGNLEQFANFNDRIIAYEGEHNADLTDTYKQADKNNREIRKAIQTLNTVRNMSDTSMAGTLATHPEFVDGLIEEIQNLDEDVMGQESKEDIINKLHDVVKLGEASKTYKAKLEEYMKNPEAQAQAQAKAHEDLAKKEAENKAKTFRDAVSGATTLAEFRAAVASAEDNETKDRVLKELEDEGSELAKTYRETQLYNNEVRRVLNSQGNDERTTTDALKLLEDQYNHSESLEQIANPNSVFVTNENAFDEEGVPVEESADRFLNAQYALQRAMSEVNNDMRFRDRFTADYKAPVTKPDKADSTKGTDRGATGADGTSTVPPVNPHVHSTTPQPPVGNITPDMMAAENAETNRSLETPATFDNKQEGSRKYYRPAIPELHIEGSKEGDFRPFKVVAKEREGLSFDAIYDYLEKNGAFDYVNSGNLKEGEEIGFMIDPEFEEQVKGEPWHKEPTIFLVTSSGQIVGSLDESSSSVAKFEGLSSLQTKVRKEYADSEKNGQRFTATPKTRVSKVMTGKVAYGSQERSLGTIPGVTDGNQAPVFGIIKNGMLTTNGKLTDDQVVKPMDMSKKEGRLYLLVPNGAGKYSPVAVRVKHFNPQEFNLDDATVNSTVMGQDINDALTRLSEATSQDDIAKAMESLAGDIYMQDVMLTWYDDARGTGITIGKKVRKDDGTYEMIDIRGEQHIKEDKIDIPFSKKSALNVGGIDFSPEATAQLGGQQPTVEVRDAADIRADILQTLMEFNLPMQVSANKINQGSYNTRVIGSGITTSNVLEARTRSNWFTMDYFDNEGNLQKAVNPSSVIGPNRHTETPVGGKDSAVSGTPITVNGNILHVDLANSTITLSNGTTRGLQSTDTLFIDLAWAQDNFGGATESPVMTGNKVITPSGKVLDRTTQKYLKDDEAQKVKDTIAGRNKDREERRAEAERTINSIYENQKRVDKTKTDGENYYVLEEDGEYHPYSRVHTVLGSNWIQSEKQAEALKLIQTKLSTLVDDPKQYDNYLQYLTNKYHVNLEAYKGKTDIRSREAIVNTVRDLMSSTNSQRALDAGTAVDSVIRQYFTTKDVSKIVKLDNMSESAYLDLLERLRNIKETIERSGERFLTDNIVLFHKYPDGTRVAGEVDILAVDADGNFKIYDVKTSRYSFYPFTDRYGHPADYFKNKSNTQRMSTKDYYTLQLSAYKNLFESQYGVPVKTLAVMPFVLSYEKDKVASVNSENGIPIQYNPSVGVPLDGAVKPAAPVVEGGESKPSTLPIFTSEVTPTSIINDPLPNSSKGKVIIDGKVVEAPLMVLDTIDDIKVHLTRVPNMTNGFGRPGEETRVGSYNYYAVFPNGQTVMVSQNVVPSADLMGEVVPKITQALKGNPQRVKDEAAKTNELTEKTPAPKHETVSNILQGQQSSFAQAAAEITKGEDKSRKRRKLRQVDSERPVWNQEQELAWLDKVMPQLSREHKVQVVKGLIRVAEKGPKAWGMFDNGMVTLSDIAAAGTTYHEAFHVVFNLLLDQAERDALYKEARQKFGEMSNDDLEEEMAEDFREFVMTRDERGLGQRIFDFFKELYYKATGWKYMRPSLDGYYRAINAGRYVGRNFNIQPLAKKTKSSDWSTIDSSDRESLSKRGWTEQKFNSISQEERDQALRCMHY